MIMQEYVRCIFPVQVSCCEACLLFVRTVVLVLSSFWRCKRDLAGGECAEPTGSLNCTFHLEYAGDDGDERNGSFDEP